MIVKDAIGDTTKKFDMMNECYSASIDVIRRIIPYLANDDDIRDNLYRSVKSISCSLAALRSDIGVRNEDVELTIKRCREVVVMLSYCKDLHGRFVNGNFCDRLMDTYSKVARKLEGGVKV